MKRVCDLQLQRITEDTSTVSHHLPWLKGLPQALAFFHISLNGVHDYKPFTTSNMDPRCQQEPTDESMGGVEDSMSTTPTGGYNNGYQSTPQGQPMQSPHYQHGQAPFSPTPDSDPNSRSGSHGYQQPMQPYSRPSSGLSGAGDRYGQAQAYQEQNRRPSQQGSNQGQTQSSVVIKVGMVGDAQIGKTSLMVKYVEGSWDEDYIQTLGIKSRFSNAAICA